MIRLSKKKNTKNKNTTNVKCSDLLGKDILNIKNNLNKQILFQNKALDKIVKALYNNYILGNKDNNNQKDDNINKDNKDILPELETMKINVKNIDEVTSYTGLKTNDGIESITVSVPVMTSQAYSVAIVKVKDNVDVEKIKQEMLDNIDMRRWICVSAEQLYITNSGNLIFSVMADKDIAETIYNDFKKYVNNNIGKELEKSNDEENIELPPEMPAAE